MSQQNSQVTVYSNPADLKKYLDGAKSVVAAALPKHLNPDRMLRLALTAFSTNPKIRQCTNQSILSSIVIASQLGLEPGVAGQGYLIPYRDNKLGVHICTFVPGWQGLVGLLNNTGRATCWTGAVYKGDDFEFELGSKPRLWHRPGNAAGADPKDLEHVYACAKVNGADEPVVECWRMARVWAHRDRFNKVGGDHYSYKHPEMYARKVVLLQVLKYMPRSIELQNALVVADATEAGRRVDVQEGVVIDVDEGGDIPQGNVGASVTEIADQEARSEKPAKAESAPITVEEGPSAAAILKDIISYGTALDAGKARIEKACIALRYMEPQEKLDKLPAKRLADILASWEEVADEIKNPGAAK